MLPIYIFYKPAKEDMSDIWRVFKKQVKRLGKYVINKEIG